MLKIKGIVGLCWVLLLYIYFHPCYYEDIAGGGETSWPALTAGGKREADMATPTKEPALPPKNKTLYV